MVNGRKEGSTDSGDSGTESSDSAVHLEDENSMVHDQSSNSSSSTSDDSDDDSSSDDGNHSMASSQQQEESSSVTSSAAAATASSPTGVTRTSMRSSSRARKQVSYVEKTEGEFRERLPKHDKKKKKRKSNGSPEDKSNNKKKKKSRTSDNEPNPDNDSSASSSSNKKTNRSTRGKQVSYVEQEEEEFNERLPTSPTQSNKKKDETLHKDDLRNLILGAKIPSYSKEKPTSSTMETCTSKEKLLSLCSQMMLVCNEAARRNAIRTEPTSKLFSKPLSESYIKERLEAEDDSIKGLLMYSNAGVDDADNSSSSSSRHLQGFIVTSDFTIWRDTFRFTMDCPATLITPRDHRVHATDVDGSLTAKLQQIERKGSNARDGFKFHRTCEIALLGALGCGSVLIRRTLSTLKESNEYDYVILQATKIAIPFYERHGFVRIGAVNRLLDNERMPEVAYRHWGEIVQGEILDPSYMMALCLKDYNDESLSTTTTTATTQIPKLLASNNMKGSDLSIEERKSEIISALKSVHSLLSEASVIRATGSTSYSCSYKELLYTALEFAISADDHKLIWWIQKAVDEFSGSKVKDSKLIIKDRLLAQNCKGPVAASAAPKIEKVDYSEKPPSFFAKNGNVKVQLKFEGGEEEEEEFPIKKKKALVAALPHALQINLAQKTSYNVVGRKEFTVKVTEATGCLDASLSYESPLRAVATIPTLLKSSDELRHYQQIAMDNMRSLVNGALPFSLKNGKRGAGSSSKSAVAIGKKIMIKLDDGCGFPFWTEACVLSSASKDDKESFNVRWKVQEKEKTAVRKLGKKNRGVGRDWCTLLDWFSFLTLPPIILDALFFNSWINYEVDGKRFTGRVSTRIGDGLKSGPEWWVYVGWASHVDARDLPYQTLKADVLRGVIGDVTDKKLDRVRYLLNNFDQNLKEITKSSESLSDNDKPEGEKVVEKVAVEKDIDRISKKGIPANEPKKKLSKDEIASKWALNRLEGHKLLSLTADDHAKLKLLTHLGEDDMIRFPTNLDKPFEVQGSNTSQKDDKKDSSEDQSSLLEKRGDKMEISIDAKKEGKCELKSSCESKSNESNQSPSTHSVEEEMQHESKEVQVQPQPTSNCDNINNDSQKVEKSDNKTSSHHLSNFNEEKLVEINEACPVNTSTERSEAESIGNDCDGTSGGTNTKDEGMTSADNVSNHEQDNDIEEEQDQHVSDEMKTPVCAPFESVSKDESTIIPATCQVKTVEVSECDESEDTINPSNVPESSKGGNIQALRDEEVSGVCTSTNTKREQRSKRKVDIIPMCNEEKKKVEKKFVELPSKKSKGDRGKTSTSSKKRQLCLDFFLQPKAKR